MGHLLRTVLLIFPMVLWAEDIYVAQTAQGGDTGADAANAHSAAWFNDSGNWGAGAGKISAGDTAHLCGTITNVLTVQGSGTAGNSITVLFETGSKISNPCFGDAIAGILVAGKSYIVIDGNSTGIIETTASGTGLTYESGMGDFSLGIHLNASFNCEIKGLLITNLYRRLSGDNPAGGGNGVRITNGTNNSVHNCSISFVLTPISVIYTSVGMTNIYVFSNSLEQCNWCVGVNDQGTYGIGDGVFIHHNTMQNKTAWDSGPDVAHHNCIYAMANQDTTPRLYNLQIYDNQFGPSCNTDTHTTSQVFLDGMLVTPLVFNNVFTWVGGGDPAEGMCYDKLNGSTDMHAKIFNNTFWTTSISHTGCVTENYDNEIVNNVFVNIDRPMLATPTGSHKWERIDYNCYFNFSGIDDNGRTFAAWQATTGNPDANGMSANALLVNPPTDCSLQSSSPAINTATNLSSYFTTDYAGNTRSGSWDIGAYEYQPPARTANAVTVHVGTMTQPTP